MKKIIAIACVVLAGVAASQANAYTLTQTEDGNGGVTFLPDGFTLTGTNFEEDPQTYSSYQTYYTQSFAVDTWVSFNWNYVSSDSNTASDLGFNADPAGYTIWAEPGTALVGRTALSGLGVNASGAVSNLLISAGQNFGWYVSSADGLNGGASLTISSLVETPVTAVPEPTGLALMLAGVGVIGLYKRSRKQVG
ncbi:PEP-CTERM sorting domain-containing protein [Uliginosibacterium sp. H3]|uniref:PEP-CTERM sorting domain-containing protein n=1 Tax=Uliginosibacterium silvisoli TaxID=3114758 RepID=A0ABU6JYD5_9RHOO|nr:PEP-CTERM sorting domain-containing protein [Uliginosibacterium sp. H3]